MTKSTFNRFENKYLINQTQYQAILSEIPNYMQADANSDKGACYPIYNIYYDTPNDDIIRASLSKPYYKEKLRLRSYGIPNAATDTVFLELKKKIGGIVSKRRATMQLWEAERFIKSGVKPFTCTGVSAQVIEEIAVFLATHEVSPKVFIGYDRCAFFGIEDKEFRLTFDSNIQTRRSEVALEMGSFGKPLLEENQYLMEIKISGAIPLWLVRILSEQRIYSTSFSKYGTEYKRHKSQFEAPEFTISAAYLPLMAQIAST